MIRAAQLSTKSGLQAFLDSLPRPEDFCPVEAAREAIVEQMIDDGDASELIDLICATMNPLLITMSAIERPCMEMTALLAALRRVNRNLDGKIADFASGRGL